MLPLQPAGDAAAFQAGLPHHPQHFSLLMNADNAVDYVSQVAVLFRCVFNLKPRVFITQTRSTPSWRRFIVMFIHAFAGKVGGIEAGTINPQNQSL